MTPITTEWLWERGGLHDARVLAVRSDGASIAIELNDEWANEHDPPHISIGGEFVLQDAQVVQGDLADIEGGWISEVTLHSNGDLIFDFCDRDRVVIKARVAMWSPAPG